MKFFSVLVFLGAIWTAEASSPQCDQSLVNPARLLSQSLLKSFRHLKINSKRISRVVQLLEAQDFKLDIPKWDYSPYSEIPDDEFASFLLILNSINFSFFDPDNLKPFQDGEVKGSSLATQRLVGHWKKLRDFDFLRQIDVRFVENILFSAGTPISMLDTRTRILREVGHFLYGLEKEGTPLSVWIEGSSENGPIDLVTRIPLVLPSWNDPFLKRAQLFVGMLYGRLREAEWVDFDRVDQLTIFADYRVPQTLIAMGIIEPSRSVERTLKKRKLIPPGSRMEMELRAASIVASERLLRAMQRNGHWGNVTPLEIDYLLWSLGRGKDMEGIFSRPMPNHHYTVTTHY